MFTAPNPGPMTLDGTNTYVVGHDPAYVIDPGPNIPEYIAAVANWLRNTDHRVEGILLTHGHHDHTLGTRRLAQALGSTPVWASATMTSDKAAIANVNRRYGAAERFDVDGDALEVLATPGHSHDHVAFRLLRSRVLFAGDTVLGRGSSVVAPADGNMSHYMQTLAAIDAVDPAIIAPGHGPIIYDPAAKITEYVEHRRQRERQILDALALGPMKTEDLVGRIYGDTDPRVLDFARSSLEAQLIKLEDEHQIRHIENEYELL